MIWTSEGPRQSEYEAMMDRDRKVARRLLAALVAGWAALLIGLAARHLVSSEDTRPADPPGEARK